VTPPLFLRLNSGALRQNETQVVARLADEIRRLTPDVILTFGPDGFTGHPTHIAIGKATDKASREAAPKAALYHVALGQRLPGWAKAADAPIPDGVTPPANLVTVQVGEYQAKRLEALKSYRTQWTPEVLGRLMEFHKAYLFEEFIWAGGANGADGKWVGP
jgi:LmbE family N-acetylglucosaminyl deacetylase